MQQCRNGVGSPWRSPLRGLAHVGNHDGIRTLADHGQRWSQHEGGPAVGRDRARSAAPFWFHRATHGRLTRISRARLQLPKDLLGRRAWICGPRRKTAATRSGAIRSDDEEARRPTSASMSLETPPRNPRCFRLRCPHAANFVPGDAARTTRRSGRAQHRCCQRGPGSRLRTIPTMRRQSSMIRFTAVRCSSASASISRSCASASSAVSGLFNVC